MVFQSPRYLFSKMNHTFNLFVTFAETEKGFIRTIGWVRFFVLILLTVRFAFGTNDVIPELIPAALWAYFIVIILLLFQADFRPDLFDKKINKDLQVIIDVLFITLFYFATGDLKSDVFQIFFLPLLIVARYATRWKDLFMFLGAVAFGTLLVWLRFYQISPEDFYDLQTWLFRLTPRIGFLTLFAGYYMVYQRRRRLSNDLKSMQEELIEQHRGLEHGVFTVDRQLRITGVNDYLKRRYSSLIIGQHYFHVFNPNNKRPSDCPFTQVMQSKEPVKAVRMKFRDFDSSTYYVNLTINPILNRRKQSTGAVAVVSIVNEWNKFEESLQFYVANTVFAADDANVNYQLQTANQTRRYKALTEATAAILSQNQPLGVKKILQRMAELLRCQLSDLRLYHEYDNKSILDLRYTFGYGLEEADGWQQLEVNSASIVAQAYRERKPVSIYDIQQQPYKMQFAAKAKRYGLYSAAAFPMMARGELIGTVSMYRNRREEFSEDELKFGQAFANSLAATMYNQQLITQISSQAILQSSQLNALREFSQNMTAHKDISVLAQLISDFTRKHLNTEVSSLFLLQDDILYRAAISGVDDDWFSNETYLKGQGLTGRVVKEGQALCENNVDNSLDVVPEHLQLYRLKLKSGQVKHLMAIPLIGREGIIGVLRIVNKLEDEGRLSEIGFSEYDLNLLTIISYSVAATIQGTRHAEEQEFLLDLAHIASFSLFDEDVLSRSLKKIIALLKVEAGAVILPEPDTQELIFAYTEGDLAERLHHISIPTSHSLIGEVFRTGKSELIANVGKDPRFYSALEKRSGTDFRTLLAVPVKMQEETLGVLVLINKKVGAFTDRDRELLSSLASWIAIAKKNSSLFAEQQRRANALLKLNTRTAEITALPDYKDTLDKIVQGVSELFDCEMAGVGIYDRRTKEIRTLPDAGVIGIDSKLIPQLRFDVKLSGGEVLRSKKIHHTFDAKTDPKSVFGQELTALVGARAIIAAPLYVGDREVGILYAASHKVRYCSDEEKQLFEAYARQAAVAIRNTELLNELERRVATLNFLRESADSASEDDLREVLLLIAEAASNILKSDATFIAPFSTKEDALDIEMSVSVGGNQQFSHSPFIREKGLTKEVLNDLHGLIIIEDFSKFPPDFAGDFVRVHGIRSCAAVRLEFKKDIVGILYVNFFNDHHFSEENLETLKLFSSYAAIIIHNNNLMRRNEDIIKQSARERLREDLHGILGSFHSRIMFATERISKSMQVSKSMQDHLGQSEHIAALDRLWRSSSSIYRQMERILHDMRDPVLTDRGLKVALHELLYSYQDELNIKFKIVGECHFSPDVELALYRITNECIHNIIKHAGIGNKPDEVVLVQLDMESPIPRLIIQDSGKGFDFWQATNVSEGMGLKLIQNWARRIQAKCDIDSHEGKGTIVSINVTHKEAIITK